MKQVNLRFVKSVLPLIMGLFFSLGAFAQQLTVTGHVKDAQGEPIIGANIVVKGTINGTITDFDGNFSLQAVSGDVISISFVGYKPVEVKARPDLVVTLEDDAIMLEGTVIIGYGTVKKSDATGAITAIKPEEMNKGLVTNAQDMLVGKVAGVSIISDGGTPGGGAQIRIRAGSSLSAINDPLIVIDGLTLDNEGIKGMANPLSMVNPSDIETFTVLKDASATAIYGSRASNGVIIITTKKGKAGTKTSVTYDGNVSVSSVRKTVDVMDGDQYRDYVGKMYAGNDDILSKLGTANTDWQDEIYRAGVSTDHNVSVMGAVKMIPYRLSLGYTNQNGIVKTSNFERFTASVSVNPTFLDDHLKVNLNGKFMTAKNRFADGGAIGASVSMDPTQPVYSTNSDHQKYFGGFYQWDVDGTSYGDTSWTRAFNNLAPVNPVSYLEQRNDRSKSHSFIGNVNVDYKLHFLPDLRVILNLGGDWSGGSQTTDISPFSATNNYYGHHGYAEKDKYNLMLNAYLQYNKELKNQYVDVTAGYEWQHLYNDSNETRYGLTPGSHPTNPGKKVNEFDLLTKTEHYLISFFGRANYSLMNRYLLTATLRADATSRFSKDDRWGYFPSVALGWKIKEEAFLVNVDALSDLKLRLGYGITGQQNINLGDYPYIPYYVGNRVGAYYPLGDTYYELYRPDAYNPNIKWETTTTWNAGLDFGFLNGRITGSVDYYNRETEDMISVVAVPAGTNFKNRVITNIGSLVNKGIEFQINAKPVVTKDFVWDLGFNLTHNKNEITKLITEEQDGYYLATGGISHGTGSNIQAHMVGYPAHSFFVYQQVYDDNGKPIENLFVDRNADGIINAADRYMYKNPVGDVLMSLSSKFMYKNWDLGFTLRSSLNNYVYNDVLADRADVSSKGMWSTSGFFTNRPTEAIELGFTGKGDYFFSDYFVQNASFLRCDNITLGYSFKSLFGAKISGRVYGAAQNVFVISNYKGLDPELNSGIDNNIYPRPFVGMVGVNLTF